MIQYLSIIDASLKVELVLPSSASGVTDNQRLSDCKSRLKGKSGLIRGDEVAQ